MSTPRQILAAIFDMDGLLQGVAGADICLYQPLQRRLHST